MTTPTALCAHQGCPSAADPHNDVDGEFFCDEHVQGAKAFYEEGYDTSQHETVGEDDPEGGCPSCGSADWVYVDGPGDGCECHACGHVFDANEDPAEEDTFEDGDSVFEEIYENNDFAHDDEPGGFEALDNEYNGDDF